METRREFVANDAKASTSKTCGEQRKVCDRDRVLEIPRAYQTSGAQQKKVSSVMTFLKTMLGLLKNEEAIYELTKVINAHEEMHETTTNRETNHAGCETLPGKVIE